MKRPLVVAILILASCTVAALAQNLTESSKQVEQEVLTAIRSRLDALSRNDIAAWTTFVADDMIAPLGGSKQDWIKTHKNRPNEVKYWYGPLENVAVRIHGDTAIASYNAKQFNEIGEQKTFTNRWQIETHVRKQGRWLLAAVADCVIPPEPTEVKIDPAIYESYAGQYEWAPTLVSTITREGDILVERFKGLGKSELAPESETTFFIKGAAASGDTSRIIFVKDSSGRVTHYIYRELGATDRIVKKIK